jgi:hypothetical protein
MNNNVPCTLVMSAATAIYPRDDHRIAAVLFAFAGYCGDKDPHTHFLVCSYTICNE